MMQGKAQKTLLHTSTYMGWANPSTPPSKGWGPARLTGEIHPQVLATQNQLTHPQIPVTKTFPLLWLA
jgi:hypothetical protein